MPLNERLNILHITARADAGGGPEVIRQLIVNSPPDLRHFVACPQEPPYWDRWWHLLGRASMQAIPPRSLDPRVFPSLVRFAREASIDIIHSHGFGGGLHARLLAAFLGKPSLHTYHGYCPQRPGGTVRQAVENLLAPWTTAGVAVSPSEAAGIVSGIPFLRGRLYLVHNGVALPPPRPTPPALRILAINRLESQKNPMALLRIAALCARRMGNTAFQLRIIGDGPLRPAMQREIERRGLQSEVCLLGARQDCGDEIGAASLFLSTAHWEGMSLALLEAMAHGVVPLVSQVTGNVDVVDHGSNGILFPLEDLAAASDAIRRLAGDEAFRARLSHNARMTIAERFPISGTANSYAAIYRRLATVEHSTPQAVEVHP
ncbi:glycosyltransferase family 4 protein [uncultured Paludibaculum sp.]|uniref:glycosyltransferase family 4 protein n=1 Tax=uncultured Paludibaculum sp. TaxID=1765020 RepID=UPI002AAAF946|nr:glycosyltransferase family 4 protein [uncultured Paludibaculum sp.]